MLLLMILKILEQYSDENHPLTHKQNLITPAIFTLKICVTATIPNENISMRIAETTKEKLKDDVQDFFNGNSP